MSLVQILDWLRRLTCRHASIRIKTTGPALIGNDSVEFPGVEVSCYRCHELWHAELDASAAMKAGLA